jgi:tetratricopeptide (TPR) repeat protein
LAFKQALPEPSHEMCANSHLTSLIADLTKTIAKEYVDMFGEGVLEDAEGCASNEVETDRRRRLVFELNRSGKFIEFQDRLKASILAVAKEKYNRDLQRDDIKDTCNALYTYLADNMHEALNALRDGKPSGKPGVTAYLQKQYHQLAEECEAAGDVLRADKLHLQRWVVTRSMSRFISFFCFGPVQEAHPGGSTEQVPHTAWSGCEIACRIAQDDVVEHWHEYGMFCMRQGVAGKAEEAFRKAIEIDANTLPSLLALACVLWHTAKEVDEMYHQDAIAVRARWHRPEETMSPFASLVSKHCMRNVARAPMRLLRCVGGSPRRPGAC